MQFFSDIAELKKIQTPVFLAAGFFDGVHRGHRALIRRTVEAARAGGGVACVLTFDRHPLCAIAPDAAPHLLCSRDESLECMAQLGVDAVLVLPFTPQLAAIEPEDFAGRLFPEGARPMEFRCGANWRFGAKGRGTPELLGRLVSGRNIAVKVEPYEIDGGMEISSTRIREAVCGGHVAEANRLLGRAFSIGGDVVRGRGEGQVALQTATANIIPDPELVLPARGVYATSVELENGSRFKALSNIGFCPSFGCESLSLETHLLGFEGDLYGQAIKIRFLDRLRSEMKFDSPSLLKEQIQKDIQTRLSGAIREADDEMPPG